MRKDYDLEDAFAAIEDELIDSMMRNMKRHKIEEVGEDKEWEMWQSLQLKSLEEYKKKNQEKFTSWFSDINDQIDKVIRQANQTGQMEQEIEILKAIKNGFKGARKSSSTMQAEFFKLNERKLDALIKATTDDLEKAEHAILRRANDQYRKAIYNAQVYANSGAGTYEKAVDMATKDMLSAGLNCVEYANGARHTLKDYADMTIRTASKRAYLQGEGTMRQKWGISTVIVNKRGNPCPKCLPFCGKVLIDDVWSGGKASDGPYPLMSYAISKGLYHPRCKDSHTTYFEGVSTPPDDKYTEKEIQQIEDDNREEQKQQYAKRQAEKYERLAEHSLDEENHRKYELKREEWKTIAEDSKESRESDVGRKVSELLNGISKQKKEFEKGLEFVQDDKIKNLLRKSYDRTVFKRTERSRSRYSPSKKTVFLAKDAPTSSIVHELFHEIDDNYSLTRNGMLKDSVQMDYRRLQNLAQGYGKSIEEMLYSKYKDAFAEVDSQQELREEYRGLSDILNGMSSGKITLGYGHEKEYWAKKGKLEAETFAQFGRCLYENNENVLSMFKDIFPNSYMEINETVKGIMK